MDLGSAVRQLQEFIPNIRDRADTTIKRMYRDDLGRFKEFKAQGEASIANRYPLASCLNRQQVLSWGVPRPPDSCPSWTRGWLDENKPGVK